MYHHLTTNQRPLDLYTFMLSTFPLYYAIMILMSITAHLRKPLCASLPKTEMSARQGKHTARLTNNRTERENICSQATFPCCAKLFFQLGEQKCQRRIRKCQSLQTIFKSCERTLCSGGRHETKSEVCIKFGYLINMSFVKAHLAK